MNAELLFKKDGTPADIWSCAACGLVYSPRAYLTDKSEASDVARRLAEDCCQLLDCEGGCGTQLGPRNKGGWLKCQDCRRRDDRASELKKANSDKVTRHTPATAPEDVFVYHDDTFFPDIGTFLAAAEDVDWVPGDFPAVVWLCESSKPQIDADSVIENFAENLELGEDMTADDVCKDVDDLRTAMDVFNAKQTESLWHPRENACVLVAADDIGIEFCGECAGAGENPSEENPVCNTCGGTGRANPDGP